MGCNVPPGSSRTVDDAGSLKFAVDEVPAPHELKAVLHKRTADQELLPLGRAPRMKARRPIKLAAVDQRKIETDQLLNVKSASA